MKKFFAIIVSLVIFSSLVVPAYADETVTTIEGTYTSQIDGTEYAFYDDGTVTRDGAEGIYSASADTLTIIINGEVFKYTYEYLNDLLLLYDTTGKGTAYEKQQLIEEDSNMEEEPITEVIMDSADSDIDFEEIANSVLMLSCYNANDELISSGSGFVAFDSKTIVTNYHVIEGICRIIAENEEGKSIEIQDVDNYDINRDIAILSVNEDTGLVPLTLGNSSQIKKGNEVFTIGSPEGLINSVSSGLLSGEILIDDQGFLQISAPISSGSSGGALLDENGQVIGITSSGFVEGQNLNFAIPINDLKELHDKSSRPMTLYECAEMEDPESLLKPGDAFTGKFIVVGKGGNLNLKVHTVGDGYFYIYLKKVNSEVDDAYAFIIKGGDDLQVRMFTGDYQIYYGVGTVWYDPEHMFGRDGRYYAFEQAVSLGTTVKRPIPQGDDVVSIFARMSIESGSDPFEDSECDLTLYAQPEGISGIEAISREEYPR